jgi:acyl-coenzyme A thioesterase PaaI-like protein
MMKQEFRRASKLGKLAEAWAREQFTPLASQVRERVETRVKAEIAKRWPHRFQPSTGVLLTPMMTGLMTELRAMVRQPRRLAPWVERYNPALSRRFLGVASNWAEPFLAGIGFKVEQLNEEQIEILMPASWRTRGADGCVHSGALAALGELTSRLYWEHALDSSVPTAISATESPDEVAGLQPKAVATRMFKRAEGEMRAVYRIDEPEREEHLRQLRSGSDLEFAATTSIYDSGAALVAEVDVTWLVLSKRVLTAGRTGEGAS